LCNDYAREIELGRILKAFKEMEHVAPFAWRGGSIPNDIAPQPHIKINDRGSASTTSTTVFCIMQSAPYQSMAGRAKKC
jgi:hypothetical protein